MRVTPAGPGAAARPPVFSLVGGSVAFDGTPVFSDIDLDIEPGSFVAVMGANGSGKTTLVRSLLGLQPLTAGAAYIHGQPLAEFRDWHRVTFVPQRLPAATGVPISALEMVSSARISPRTRWHRDGKASRRAALAALEAVGLADRRAQRVDTMSGGQQRRIMIARSLAEGADTLVLDEPMAGVDLANQHVLTDILRRMQVAGRTIVLVTHGLGGLAELVTRSIIIESGRIAFDGAETPDGWVDVHHHSEHPAVPTILED